MKICISIVMLCENLPNKNYITKADEKEAG